MVQTITLVNKKLGTEASLRLDLGQAVGVDVLCNGSYGALWRVPLSSHQVWRARRKLNPGLIGRKVGPLGETPLVQRPRQVPNREYKVVEDEAGFWVLVGQIGGKL